MRSAVRSAYAKEMTLANEARVAGDFGRAVSHVERAHILGQRYLLPHLQTHWFLLSIARERGDGREMLSQIVRLIAVVPGFLFGWVPRGNIGSGRVSALKPMDLPADIAPLLADDSIARDVALRVVVLGLVTATYLAVAA